ncbi:MAG: alpha-2-macroglobulin domain protein [Thermoleophilia bacterium]|nr:alpha-2-macroglobulin domain protein [Thermoleophilia bacterium]
MRNATGAAQPNGHLIAYLGHGRCASGRCSEGDAHEPIGPVLLIPTQRCSASARALTRGPVGAIARMVLLTALAVAALGGPGVGSAAGATTLDLTGCPAGNLALGTQTPPFAVRTGTCAVLFGDTLGTSTMRIYQTDGVAPAMPAYSDFATGTTDWSLGARMFGACLESATGGASAGWTAAGDADCAAANGDPWLAVPATSAGAPVATTSASATGTATVRFGLRGDSMTPPGASTAALTVEIIAAVVNSSPSVPALVSPADATIVASTTPALSATFSDPDAADTGLVRFQLCTTSACGTVLQTGVSGTVANGANGSWTPTALTPGTTYFWRAQNQDAGLAVSAYSAARSFMVNSAPSVPALVSPATATIAASTTPSLTATFSDPNTGDTGLVRFQVCTTSACGTVLQTGTSAAGLASATNGSWTPATLTPGTTYFWRAQNQDGAGATSAYSAAWSFTVNSTPGATTLVSPTDATVVASATPSLVATFSDATPGDSGLVRFQLCSTSACGLVLQTGSSAGGLATGANGTWSPTALTPGSTYYWRARSEDSSGATGAFSTVWSFTVNSAPAGATLTSPANGSLVASTTPALAATHRLQPWGHGTRPIPAVLHDDMRDRAAIRNVGSGPHERREWHVDADDAHAGHDVLLARPERGCVRIRERVFGELVVHGQHRAECAGVGEPGERRLRGGGCAGTDRDLLRSKCG